MDLKTATSSGIAVVMAVAAGLQQFRVQDLDADLGNVATARDKAMGLLKETRDGVEANAKRADVMATDYQAQLEKANTQMAHVKEELGREKGRNEALESTISNLAANVCPKRR